MTEKQVNINYLKRKYISPTWENMLEECRDWYREGLEQGKFDKEVEKQQLISFLEDKIKGYNDEIQHCREVQKEYPKVKEDIRDFYVERDIYQEILDFVKGGKDE